MTRSQQIKVYNAMTEEQKARVKEFVCAGLSRNTAISSVIMQDMIKSKLPAKMVVYSA